MALQKRFLAGRLRVAIYDTREEMGQAAGEMAAKAICQAVRRRGQANVMFAAAPSQNETLRVLSETPGIPWEKVNAFHMDEYVGLPAGHPALFREYLDRTIWKDHPFASIHRLNGDAADIDGEISRYSDLLRRYPLDVCLLGIGENGHIAFNDPPVADFADPAMVKQVALEERCRLQQVHDGCFASLRQVPTHALTVTIPPIMAAKVLCCTVPGKTKAEAVGNMVHLPLGEVCPATILRTHPGGALFLDAAAGERLL